MRNKCVWKLLCLLLTAAAMLACVPAAAAQRADIKDDMRMYNLPAGAAGRTVPAFRTLSGSRADLPAARTGTLRALPQLTERLHVPLV